MVIDDKTYALLKKYIDEHGGGGGGGHAIENDEGPLTQRETLKFEGFATSDDSTGKKTVVKNPVFIGTTAEWGAVTDKSKYELVNLIDNSGVFKNANGVLVPIADTTAFAHRTDITDLFITGTVNNTGATIARRTCFYLNGELVVALADINDGESFTEDTNYKRTTICDNYIRGKVLYKNVLPEITPAPTDWAVIGSVSATPSNVYADTATMFISALVMFASGKPTGIALSMSNSKTPNADNSLAFSEKGGTQAVSTMLGLGYSTSTVFVWAKWETSRALTSVYLNAFVI